MKKISYNYIIVFMITVISFSSVKAEKIFNVEFGLSYLPVSHLSRNYVHYDDKVADINQQGFMLGFFVPINIKPVSVHLKIEKAYHHVSELRYFRGSNRTNPFISPYDDHIYTYTVIELLAGRIFHVTNSYSFLPQIGLGYTMDEVYGHEPYPGFGDYRYFLSFSVIMKRRVSIFEFGYMLHIEKGIYDVNFNDVNSTVKIKTGIILAL